MRLIAPGGLAPAEVNKYLLPHEQQVITVRRHPAVLMGPALLTLGGLIAAVVLSDTVLKGCGTWPGSAGGSCCCGSSGRRWAGRSTTSWSPHSG